MRLAALDDVLDVPAPMLLKMLGTSSGAGGMAADVVLPGTAAAEVLDAPLVLPVVLVAVGAWEDELPRPRFAAADDALGSRFDSCSRVRRSEPAGRTRLQRGQQHGW